MITKSDTSVGGRERITYHITDSGRSALADWLCAEQISNELRYETLLKLFFGGVQDKKVTLHNIELFEGQIKSDLEVLKGYAATLEQMLEEKDHVYYYLTGTRSVFKRLFALLNL